VVLEKDGKDQFGCSYGQWRSMTKIQGGNYHRTCNKMNADWIGHSLLWNSLLICFTFSEGQKEGNIVGTRKEEEDVRNYWVSLRGKKYWNLKWETLDHTLWRNRFGRGSGPVAKQTTYLTH
jgi:hypothetical protein